MGTVSALLAIYAKSTGDRTMQRFDALFVVNIYSLLNKKLSDRRNTKPEFLCRLTFIKQLFYLTVWSYQACQIFNTKFKHYYSKFCWCWRISAWWRHQMENFSVLLALCAGNSPVTGEFPSQRPVTRSFDVFFHQCLNEHDRETGDLRHHCAHYDVIVIARLFVHRTSFKMEDEISRDITPLQKWRVAYKLLWLVM